MVVGCAQYAIIVTHPSRLASLAGAGQRGQNANKMRVAFSIGCDFLTNHNRNHASHHRYKIGTRRVGVLRVTGLFVVLCPASMAYRFPRLSAVPRGPRSGISGSSHPRAPRHPQTPSPRKLPAPPLARGLRALASSSDPLPRVLARAIARS